MPEWPNVEEAVVAWLGALGRPVYTETGPSTPAEYLVVERVGGAGTAIDQDVDVEVSVIAPTRAAMWALVSQVEARMEALAANGTDTYVDDVALTFGFKVDPYPNVTVRRATATFTVTVRPQ